MANTSTSGNVGILAAIKYFGTQAALASALGVSTPTVWEWRTEKGAVPPKRCVEIERLTNGVVSRRILRDDWRDFWPELDSEAV